MAKVIFKTLGGMASIECEAVSPKDAFKKLAILQEMCSEKECGCCHSTNIAYRVRTAENRDGAEIEYYEMKCLEPNCGAALQYGQHTKAPTLFAKRWDKESRTAIPNNGWVIYVRGSGDSHHHNQQQGGGYQPPQQQGGYQQGGGYPQQGGRQPQQQPPQQQGWGAPQQPLGPPPGQGNDIPF